MWFPTTYEQAREVHWDEPNRLFAIRFERQWYEFTINNFGRGWKRCPTITVSMEKWPENPYNAGVPWDLSMEGLEFFMYVEPHRLRDIEL
jgi:hypothetical protein